jgi:hypothetical protein
MLLDQEQVLADRVAITTTAIMPHVKDLGPFSGTPPNTFRDIGGGQWPPWLYILVTTAFAGGPSIVFEVLSDDNAALSTPTIHYSTAAIPLASLVKGYELKTALPPSQYQQYLGVRATVAGTMTGGAVIVAIVEDVDKIRQYRGNSPSSA